jgi:predicted DNA-binding transcriptional regulator AlpA
MSTWSSVEPAPDSLNARFTIPEEVLAHALNTLAARVVALMREATPAEPDWLWTPLTRRDAAAFLAISEVELSRMAVAGEVPVSYALGRRSPRFFRMDLLDWMRGRAAAERIA